MNFSYHIPVTRLSFATYYFNPEKTNEYYKELVSIGGYETIKKAVNKITSDKDFECRGRYEGKSFSVYGDGTKIAIATNSGFPLKEFMNEFHQIVVMRANNMIKNEI